MSGAGGRRPGAMTGWRGSRADAQAGKGCDKEMADHPGSRCTRQGSSPTWSGARSGNLKARSESQCRYLRP